MPTYDYFCEKCDKNYETIVSIHQYDGKDKCPECGNIGQRIFSCKIEFIGTKVEDAEYNVGLGRITKSKRHRQELANQLGAVEIGNEKPETVFKHFDTQREEKLKKAYDDE